MTYQTLTKLIIIGAVLILLACLLPKLAAIFIVGLAGILALAAATDFITAGVARRYEVKKWAKRKHFHGTIGQ